MWTITLPLRIPCNDRSRPVKHRPGWKQPYFSLNLNQFRNAHFQVLNNAKVNFNILAKRLIRAANIPKLNRCTLEYVLYPGTAQICDTNNVCSIVDKFFSDSLVHAKVLPDDNYNFLINSCFRFGGIDRQNPRVDVIIRDAEQHHAAFTPVLQEPLTKKENSPMKIVTRTTHHVHLTDEDLTEAVRKYLADFDVQATNLELAPLEGGGYDITVIHDESSEPVAPAAPAKRGGRRPKAEPKAAMEKVAEKLEESKESAKKRAAKEAEELEQEEEEQEEEATPVDEPEETDDTEEPEPQKPQRKNLFGKFPRPKN